jgi:hypothetical protein
MLEYFSGSPKFDKLGEGREGIVIDIGNNKVLKYTRPKKRLGPR